MTTLLAVGVDLREVQIAARHTPAHRATTRDPPPRTWIAIPTTAAYIASGTQPEQTPRSDSADVGTVVESVETPPDFAELRALVG